MTTFLDWLLGDGSDGEPSLWGGVPGISHADVLAAVKEEEERKERQNRRRCAESGNQEHKEA